MRGLSVATDPHRGVKVQDTLQSIDDPDIFAIGDCADIADYKLPRIGVFGVRAAPVLLANLVAQTRNQAEVQTQGDPLQSFKPQHKWLAAQNLGDGTGLAWWGVREGEGGPAWRGRTALWLKNWIDVRFVKGYQALY